MKLYTLLFVLLSTYCFSQRPLDNQLGSISSVEDAKSYIKANKTGKAKLITFNSLNDQTPLAKELFELSVGEKTSYNAEGGKTIYKVIEKQQIPHYKVSLMEFDSNKMPYSEINSLRAFILKGLISGEHKFENLARVYSTHPTGETGGNLGWVKKGTLSPKFEKIINSKKVGKPFIYDESRKRKHYIVLKSEPNAVIEEITVLKVTQVK